MTGTTTLEFWQLILIVLLPAALSATAAILAPSFTEGRRQKAELRKQRAEKLEELFTLLYAHTDWLDRATNVRVSGNNTALEPSPIIKARGIVLTHFPQFIPKTFTLVGISYEHESEQFEAAAKKLQGDPNYATYLDELHKKYLDYLNCLVVDLAVFGEKEFSPHVSRFPILRNFPNFQRFRERCKVFYQYVVHKFSKLLLQFSLRKLR